MSFNNTADVIKTSILTICVTATTFMIFYLIYDFNIRNIEVRLAHAKLYDNAIRQGVNPMLVDCAINMMTSDQLVCLAISKEYEQNKFNQIVTENTNAN